MLKLQFAGYSDRGIKRAHNEDHFGAEPARNLFIVADGVGGYAAGEVASHLAVDTIRDFVRDSVADQELTWPGPTDPSLSEAENMLVNAIVYANRRIFDASESDETLRGMGTTIVGVLLDEGGANVAHVGDSRCYRVRGGRIERLTEDHSLLNELKKVQPMTEEEEAAFPHRNVILRSLGAKRDVSVEVSHVDARVGDIFLLCSDGLSGELHDRDILKIVTAHGHDLDAMTQALYRAACDAGGRDNVTALAVKVVAG